jgi:hypothetical protein
MENNTKKETLAKSETLKYHQGMTSETIVKMEESRKKFYEFAQYLESLGSSRELSIAFTNIETAQMYVMKHLCLVDPEATRKDL